MNKYLIYGKSLVKVISARLKYGKRLSISYVQSFGSRLNIYIGKKGKLIINKGMITREFVDLRIESGIMDIGINCFFNINTSITCIERISIGDNCSFGPNCVIIDHDHDFKNQTNGLFISKPVSIGDNTWVGANVVILRGTTIGKNCVIGAGAIVRGNIPEGSILIQKREQELQNIGVYYGK